MSLTDLLKQFNKKVILPITLAGAALFANKAYAQEDTFDDVKKEQKEKSKTPSLLDDEQKVLEKLADGYFKFEGHTSPVEHGFSGQFGLRFNGDWMPTFYAQSSWNKFDNGDEDSLEVLSNRAVFELATYLKKSKEFEFYFAPHVGYELNKLDEIIDMDANRAILGAQIGLASQENGSRLLFTFDAGFGDYDAELQSGFETDGDYRTLFLGVEGSQRLWKDGKKSIAGSEFEFARQLGEEFENSLYLSIAAYLRKDEFDGLQTSDGWGIQASLPYIFNARDYKKDAKGNVYGEGILWTFEPGVRFRRYDNESELSSRTSDSNEWQLYFGAKAQVSKFVAVKAELGYDLYMLDIKGRDKHEDGGIMFKLGLDINF
jgi:hypothetical protein